MKKSPPDFRTFNPINRKAWRKWLEKNHKSTESVCVVIFGKKSSTPNVTYDDVVEEALCFGWIDNKGMKRDDESMFLRVCPRKEKSNWSKLNRQRVEKMVTAGLMTPAGQVHVDIVKKSGRWDAVDALDTIPPDLQTLFNKKKRALKNFEAFSPSSRRLIIQWILGAKKPETRKQRIEKTVGLAAENVKAR